MRLRVGGLLLVAAVLSPGAWAQGIAAGSYLCTVEKRTGVSMTHLEGAPPPDVFVDTSPKMKFRMKVEEGGVVLTADLPHPRQGPGVVEPDRQDLLDLEGGDVLAAAPDRILQPADARSATGPRGRQPGGAKW